MQWCSMVLVMWFFLLCNLPIYMHSLWQKQSCWHHYCLYVIIWVMVTQFLCEFIYREFYCADIQTTVLWNSLWRWSLDGKLSQSMGTLSLTWCRTIIWLVYFARTEDLSTSKVSKSKHFDQAISDFSRMGIRIIRTLLCYVWNRWLFPYKCQRDYPFRSWPHFR